MLKKVYSIALLNFRIVIKDKIFIGIVFSFLFYLLICIFLSRLSVGYTEKVLKDFGLLGIELTGLILIIFSYIFHFYREKDTQILRVYLSNFSKPVYLTGKILGYFFVTFLYILFSIITLEIILFFYHIFDSALLVMVISFLLKMFIMVTVVSLFSSLFSSPLLALLSTVFLYAAAHLAPSALRIVSFYGSFWQKILVKCIYHLLPNLDKLDIRYLVVWGNYPSLEYIGKITVYSSVYIIFLWLLGICIFEKKEV